MRGWRNWHTRRFQMPVIVKYHVGSNPIPRTKKNREEDDYGRKNCRTKIHRIENKKKELKIIKKTGKKPVFLLKNADFLLKNAKFS